MSEPTSLTIPAIRLQIEWDGRKATSYTSLVRSRFRAWVLITAVACICAAAVWSVSWYRARNLTAPALMKRLPTSGAVVVFVDFAALRQAHILDFLDDP